MTQTLAGRARSSGYWTDLTWHTLGSISLVSKTADVKLVFRLVGPDQGYSARGENVRRPMAGRCSWEVTRSCSANLPLHVITAPSCQCTPRLLRPKTLAGSASGQPAKRSFQPNSSFSVAPVVVAAQPYEIVLRAAWVDTIAQASGVARRRSQAPRLVSGPRAEEFPRRPTHFRAAGWRRG